ncbi:hypothetical protein SLEP1_g51514 [Rubroshorea leprosula]|uniref:Uncharacterized protein n=1 Tax=Rubroshorea leprosula TaxID=152421 RepID=A0AAV5M725_9ROSI|nr:hypothetical protein SLEP1_g51514 [Rubroshorea leprosula]
MPQEPLFFNASGARAQAGAGARLGRAGDLGSGRRAQGVRRRARAGSEKKF